MSAMEIKPFEVLKLSQGRRIIAGQEVFGLLSDGTGSISGTVNVNVPRQNGKVYVRFPAGSDDAGTQLYDPPVPIREGVGAAYIKKGGRKVWVGLGPTGQPEIKRGDWQELTELGFTPAVTNPLTTEGKTANPANPFLGLFSDAPGTAHSPSTKVTVYPLWYDTGTDLKYYAGTETEADKVDLASFIPGAGEYCYVMLWLDTDTNALETPTASTPATMTSTFGNADRITALQECYAARPNASCIPITAYYLANAQTAVVQNKKNIDFRQMINMPSTGGSTPPFVDTTAIVKGSADATKLLRFEVDGFTTGTTRVATFQNSNGTVAYLSDIPAAAITQLTGDVTAGPGSGSQVATLANTAVTPGSYTAADITVDQKGRLTAAASAASTGTGSVVRASAPTISNPVISGGSIDNTPIGGTTPAAGYFSDLRIKVSTFLGRLTASLTAARTWTFPDKDITVAGIADIALNAVTGLTGDVTGTGPGATAATLATVNSTTGTFKGIHSLTTNGKGLDTEVIEGQNWLKAVRVVAVPGALGTTTYNNGTGGVGATLTKSTNGAMGTIDGLTMATGDRVLMTPQLTSTNGAQGGGIYEVTSLGSAGTPWVMTRVTDSNTGADFPNQLVYITSGTLYGRTLWVCTSLTAPTMGTSGIAYVGGVLLSPLVNIAILTCSKTSGTSNGSTTTTTYVTQPLNTEFYDPDGIVTLSSDKMTPIAGTYKVTAFLPFVGASGSVTIGVSRLFNVTTTTEILKSAPVRAAADSGSTMSIAAEFAANGTDEYRFETYVTAGRATNGLGGQVGTGTNEIYAIVLLERVA